MRHLYLAFAGSDRLAGIVEAQTSYKLRLVRLGGLVHGALRLRAMLEDTKN